MTIEIADRLVKLRKKYGYSQEELADKLGLSRQAVSKWERAEASPDTDNLICLAKLYGVSLDELLATDEDLDTIVEEQVKDNKEEKEDDKETVIQDGKDRVVINKKGIFVQDKDGSTVTIGSEGIVCHDKDGEFVKKCEPLDPVIRIINGVEAVLGIMAVIAFLLMGLLLGMWTCAWIVFFIPEILCSIARCIRKKNAQHFNMVFTACFVFFLVCMFLPFPNTAHWEIMWVVFLAIPLYHSIVGLINKALGKEEDKIFKKDEDKDDDDDNDDDDDDDKVIDAHIKISK